MGVPKFYRWVSERYPCLSQVIKEYQIPEFDNMYLDMNGIIHPCSHPNDDDAHFRITETEIFQNIFNYIDVIFRLIKPRKVFFMAVDGVAPRAKMNQQRARRFRSAMDAALQKEEALAKGETLPEEAKFDSNCITPGTEFMCKLHEQLKYFVNKKISSDPAWQSVKIILSGHDVPGEGEHKIMEYIRYFKQQPDYNPNTRHCLYGLDADLMFLGLATHELHFSLLREEVKFGKTQKRIATAEEQCFHLLHLSLFREYVDKEFNCLKEALGEEYDLERVIDDFILLSFLVGNDFIPHLPDFHIHAQSLPILWKTYKEVRPNLDGYLHMNGDLDLARFGTYLQVLSKFDMENFEVQYEDLKWMAGKSEERKSKGHKQSETDRLKEKFGAMMLLDSDQESEQEDSEEEADMLQNEFKVQKKRYYCDKFGLSKKDIPDFLTRITFKYVEGLQWILQYYFQGVPSWSWYYPFHYAPYLSDIQQVAGYTIALDLSTPFTPFQQLMAVLPPGSSKLLPTVLQELYKNTSDIVDFYPPNFKTDLNGKKMEWEAVVLIPFIEEARLVGAMLDPLSHMTDDEKARNKHGPCFEGTYDEFNNAPYPSSLPGVFPELKRCHTRMDVKDKHCYRIPPEALTYTFPDKNTDPFTMGFPTSKHLKHTAVFESAGCKIFSYGSREANCILQVDPQEAKPLEDYTSLLGEVVYVDFPHLVEALVVAVHNETHHYILDDNCVVKKPAVANKKDSFKHLKSRECISLKSRWGLDVGDVRVMVCVKKIRGKVPTFRGDEVTLVKHWCEDKTWVPGQLVLTNLKTPIPVQEKSENLTLARIFPKDAKVFVIANPGYGSMGVVEDVMENRIKVQLKVNEVPLLQELRRAVEEADEDWYFPREICSDVGISPLLLSKITSTFKIAVANKNGRGTSDMNIGLSIKYSGRSMMAPEYARRIENGGWQYSDALVKIVKGYVEQFPELFEELENHLKADKINATDIARKFGPEFNIRQYLDEIRKHLKALPLNNCKLVGVGSEVMASRHIEKLLKDLKKHKNSIKTHELVVKVKPRVLFNPTFQNGVLPPDTKAEFRLCDRVVNVAASHCVPFGLIGTIVGLRKTEDQSSDSIKYEVLFDEAFIGGSAMGPCSSHLYTMLPFTLINFSHGTRANESESNSTKSSKAQTKVEVGKDNLKEKMTLITKTSPSENKEKSKKEILKKVEEKKKTVSQNNEKKNQDNEKKNQDNERNNQNNESKKNRKQEPRKKKTSVSDMDADDHLNYHESQWATQRGVRHPPPSNTRQSYQPPQPFYPQARSSNMTGYNAVPYNYSSSAYNTANHYYQSPGYQAQSYQGQHAGYQPQSAGYRPQSVGYQPQSGYQPQFNPGYGPRAAPRYYEPRQQYPSQYGPNQSIQAQYQGPNYRNTPRQYPVQNYRQNPMQYGPIQYRPDFVQNYGNEYGSNRGRPQGGRQQYVDRQQGGRQQYVDRQQGGRQQYVDRQGGRDYDSRKQNDRHPSAEYEPNEGREKDCDEQHQPIQSTNMKNKNQKKRKDAEYEEEFYHGDFYSIPTNDPYITQPGKPPQRLDKEKNIPQSGAQGTTHYYY